MVVLVHVMKLEVLDLVLTHLCICVCVYTCRDIRTIEMFVCRDVCMHMYVCMYLYV